MDDTCQTSRGRKTWVDQLGNDSPTERRSCLVLAAGGWVWELGSSVSRRCRALGDPFPCLSEAPAAGARLKRVSLNVIFQTTN